MLFIHRKSCKQILDAKKLQPLAYLIGEATILFSTTIQTTLHVGGN